LNDILAFMDTNDTLSQSSAVVSEEPAEFGECPRYLVDPASPEFTNVLMKCFTEGRNKAIDELHALQRAGMVKDD
jgi:hypothetical protein